MFDIGLATALGRPDLAYGAAPIVSVVPVLGISPDNDAAMEVGEAPATVGRIAAGLLILMTLSLAGLYVWTKDFQA